MQVDASKNQNLAFSYTTTSGKSLSLAMYDKQSVSLSANEGGKSLSLRREYGFSFSFVGSKLSEDEVKEIKNAMSGVQPLIDDFLQSSKVGELEPKDFITKAMQMADVLPTPKDENALNATMSSLVDKFNSLLQKPSLSADLSKEGAQKLLEDSKKLIEEVLAKMQEKLKEQENLQRILSEENTAKKDSEGVNLLA